MVEDSIVACGTGFESALSVVADAGFSEADSIVTLGLETGVGMRVSSVPLVLASPDFMASDGSASIRSSAFSSSIGPAGFIKKYPVEQMNSPEAHPSAILRTASPPVCVTNPTG